MALVKIPPVAGLNLHNDEVTLPPDQSAYVMNCFVGDNGETHARPACVQSFDLGTHYPVDGLFSWLEKGLLIAVSHGRVYKWNGTSASEITGPASLPIGANVSFSLAPDVAGDYLYMTAGGVPIYTDGTNLYNAGLIAFTDPISMLTDYPLNFNISSLTEVDGYLLAAEKDTDHVIWYTNNGGVQDRGDFFAGAESDTIQSIGMVMQEVPIFGSRTTEFWFDDGVTPFSRIRGAITHGGMDAPFSLTQIENNYAYLDGKRRAVMFGYNESVYAGRQPQIISERIQPVLQAPDAITTSDSTGYYVTMGGHQWWVLNFPTLNRTFVYEIRQKQWHEWGTWNASASSNDMFIGKCHALHLFDGNNYVGSRLDGKVYRLDMEGHADAGPLVIASRTGNIDHGTSVRKRTSRLYVRVRRGDGGSATPLLTLRWRDDGAKAWSGNIQVDLGKAGDAYTTRQLLGVGGVHRTRQYEWTMTANAPCVVSSMEEDVEPMVS